MIVGDAAVYSARLSLRAIRRRHSSLVQAGGFAVIDHFQHSILQSALANLPVGCGNEGFTVIRCNTCTRHYAHAHQLDAVLLDRYFDAFRFQLYL